MTTSPVIPNISESKSWLQRHETLLIVVFILGTLIFVGNKWISSHYDAAVKVSSAAAQVLAMQTQTNKELEDKYDQLNKNNQALTQQLTQQNQVLVQQAAAAQVALTKQQTADAVLSNQRLVDRLNTLTGQSIQANANGGADLTQKQVVSVTQSEESVPVLKQELQDETTLAGNKDSEIISLTNLNSSASISIGGLQAEIKDQTDSCNAQIKVLKAKNLKSKLKWFGAGFVSGVVATVAAVIH